MSSAKLAFLTVLIAAMLTLLKTPGQTAAMMAAHERKSTENPVKISDPLGITKIVCQWWTQSRRCCAT